MQAAYLMAARQDLRIFRPSLAGYAEIVKFGGGVLINVFYSSAPQLFLARVLDFAAVGLYSRAVNVTQVFDKLVTQVISPVIIPAIFAQTSAGQTSSYSRWSFPAWASGSAARQHGYGPPT